MSTIPALYPKETAIAIRKVLRAAFPVTKFRVTTGRGSMVSSVHVSWTDGPTPSAVESLVYGFKAGNFDGMTDSYNYDRSKYLLVEGVAYRPACQYLFCDRHISPKLATRCIEQVAKYWGATEIPSAVESFQSFKLVPDIGTRSVTDRANVDWGQAIYRASLDRTTYAGGI